MKKGICVFCFILFGMSTIWGQKLDSLEIVHRIDSLNSSAEKLIKQRKFSEALAQIEPAEKMVNELGLETVLKGKVLLTHGLIFYQTKKLKEAEGYFIKSKIFFEKINFTFSEEYATTLNRLGNLYSDMSRNAEAEKYFLEGLDLREKAVGKKHISYATIQINLAILYKDWSKYDDSEHFFKDALATLESLNPKNDYATLACLNGLANLFSLLARYHDAEKTFLLAEKIARNSLGKENADYAKVIHNLGSLYSDMGQFSESEKYLLQAKDIRYKILGSEHPNYAGTLNNLGGLYQDIGMYSEAEKYYIEAKKIWEKTIGKEHPYYSGVLSNLGVIYEKQKKYSESESVLIESKEIRLKAFGDKNPEYAWSLNNLADLYFSMGNKLEAEKLYIQSKEIRLSTLGKDHPLYSSTLNNLADLYSSMNRLDEAESLCIESINILKTQGNKNNKKYSNSLSNLISIYLKQGRLPLAIEKIEELSIVSQSSILEGASFLSPKELSNYAGSYSRQFNDVFSIIYSNIHKYSGLSTIGFSNILFHKGFILNAASTLSILSNQDSSTAKSFNLLSAKRNNLNKEFSKPFKERSPYLPQWENEANALEKELVRSVPGYAEAIRPVDWKQVQNSLQTEAAAIEFVKFKLIFPKETDSVMYAALVLRPGEKQPVFVSLCEQRQLEAILSQKRPENDLELPDFFQKQYESPRLDGRASLYQLLWKPLEPHLKGIKTVYFSPDGDLHRLNLAAIAPDKSGKTLADRYHLVQLSSTRQLVVEQANDGKPKIEDAAIFGGALFDMDTAAILAANRRINAPAQDTTGGLFKFHDNTQKQPASSSMRGENWQYLPGTLREAMTLDSILRLHGIHSNLLTGYAASEEAVKYIGRLGIKSPGLLHIGTHGFFFSDPKQDVSGKEPVFKISEFPMIRAGLLLSGAKYAWNNNHPAPGMEDQILTAQDASQLNLRQTQLAVLSACDTGLGEIEGHEGVFGLQRAFRLAGARNLIMSLWRVRDDAAEAFFGHFYDNWLNKNMSLRMAFDDTQNWMRGQEQYENPFFWAGFVLIGAH